jgi:hypothetical protein
MNVLVVLIAMIVAIPAGATLALVMFKAAIALHHLLTGI